MSILIINNKDSTNNSIIMEETGNIVESNVTENERVEKKLSPWIEVKEILHNENLNELHNDDVKNEGENEKLGNDVMNKDIKLEAPEIRRITENEEHKEINAEKSVKLPAISGDSHKTMKNSPEIERKNESHNLYNNTTGEMNETETIQLIEETIIIPEIQNSKGMEKPDEAIEYESEASAAIAKVAPSSVLTTFPHPPKSSPTSTEISQFDEIPKMTRVKKSSVIETKQRTLIEDIFDDWTDENTEEEESHSSKVDDSVEHQLKTLLDGRSSISLEPEKTPNILETKISENCKNDETIGKEEKPLKSVDEHPADNKELLAILEDDAEPDWSNLKPPALADAPNEDDIKSIEHDSPPKLDPLIERQLALKQLLELPVTSKKPRISPRKSPVIPKKMIEEDETIEEIKFDETRSGRKRKPTEKAREHEISAKRTKNVKPKILGAKPLRKHENNSPENEELSADTNSNETSQIREKKNSKKSIRKITPKATNLVKNASKKSSKLSTSIQDTPRPRKKTVNEIDRLLQDEGVVNLLYDVEQPAKKRLIPVTKSHAKVMDIQKVQRELRIRTKLVKNAVLRLRTSASPGPNAPRAKRSSVGSIFNDDTPQETNTISKGVPSNSEFSYPAKIKNAADASIIVRRHSSSSFSSASGSPRVSVDSSEKHSVDDGKLNQLNYLHEERKKTDAKRLKKKKKKNNITKSRGTLLLSKGKMDKKPQASLSDRIDEMKTNGKFGKIKRNLKNKVTFAKATDLNDESDNNADVIDGSNLLRDDNEQDELSACLAEAVSALANESTNRKSTPLNRKGKQRGNVKMQFINKEINVQRHGNLVQLILTPSVTSKIRNGITLQMIQELKDVLTILKKDDDCRVVLLTSTGSSFCEGLELSTLLQENTDTRRTNAQLLANGVKDFIKSLATFNKPIVAGVQGSAVGLGVTMLPLFDLVIASDKASFSTPYGKLGQIAEGAAVFTLSHVLGSAVTSELLLGGRTLTANEALRAGLVTRVLWPDRFHVELLPSLRAMSEQSSQSMEATKALLRHSLRTKLDAALESECYLLVQHWCSSECQNAIRAYLDEEV